MQCGTQCTGCDYPIHFDTYTGCSFACSYCFANEKPNKNIVAPTNGGINALRLFISGKRTSETRFCDWSIPIHWGSTSDPFQPIEKTECKTLECLKLLAETKYPFIISTKGTLIAEEPYISLISECECVVQISAACKEYDIMEMGAPEFEERIKAIKKLRDKAKRINIRIQPYFPMYFSEIKENLKVFSEAGAYGIIIEGFSTRRKNKCKEGMEYNGSRYQYPVELLSENFKEIKNEAHKCGLKFFCGETRLQFLGDDLTCCGTSGLGRFIPNKYNLPHMAYDVNFPIPTEAMNRPSTARPFRSVRQTTEWYNQIKSRSFAEMMENNEEYVNWLRELKEVYG
ncbi:hypothetical protein C805_00085 [Eubacterium sp. 14-2]|nr:hypothetical protein C805_00085 [Eubacterium sp. 14-2]